MHARVRHMREQSIIRAWEYRQRSSSKGVWHRFRRILVNAAEAWIIGEADADMLEAVLQRKQVPVRLHGELLLARSMVFISHVTDSAGSIDP